MSLTNVNLVDAFTGTVLSDAVLVGYEERRIYLPDTCLVWAGHVVNLQRCDEPLQSPLQVHTEYASLVKMLSEEIHESLMTEADFQKIITFPFFILTEGVGIKLESLRPSVFPYEISNSRIVSLSVFHTKEGIVPHKLVVPPDHNINVTRTLLEVLSSKIQEASHIFVSGVHPFLFKEDKTHVYMFEVPRVIPIE